MKYFKPNYYFKHYSDIKGNWLTKEGITTILSDIDSTLAPHNELGDESLLNWIGEMKKYGVEIICISNNTAERAKVFSEAHGIKAIGNCSKPNTTKIEEFIKKEEIDKKKVAVLGDQLFTDIWVGKRLGVKTVLVHPIGTHQPIGIKLKRIIEKTWIKKWGINA